MRRPGCRCDESESTPLHIGSLPGYLAGIQESLQGGKWNDGDVVIHNHPYYGSSHSPDIAVVIPVFHKGELVAYSANTAHHLDIGAATPGLIIDIPDVYAEGMLFAGTKLYEKGVRNEAMWEYIRRNSRTARQLQDDLDAQIASARLGVRRFNELLDRYGMDTVLTATGQLMDYTERVLRQRIAGIPDGEYRAEGFLDDDGRNRDVRLPIKVCVRVKGDGIEIDLTGSAVERHPRAAHRHLERQRQPAAGSADRDRIGGGVPVVRGGNAGGGESGLAPRHGRLEPSKTGPHMSTRAAGSEASSNRPLRYFAGSADRWVVLPVLNPHNVQATTRAAAAPKRP